MLREKLEKEPMNSRDLQNMKDVEKKYYADGEDAHDMRKTFARLAEEAEKNQDVDVDSTLLQELKLLSVVG